MREQVSCSEIAFGGDPIDYHTLLLKREGEFYTIKVTYPGYLEELKSRNMMRPPEGRIDENFFVLRDITNSQQFSDLTPEALCQRLSRVETKTLLPHLTKQDLS